MNSRPPLYEKPVKNYIRFDIYKAGVAIIATLARIRNEAVITWQETVKPLTMAQAQEYVMALRKSINWASVQGAGPMGWVNNPGPLVETDNLTFTRRLLFYDDDTMFVEVRRSPLAFGLYTKPVVTLIDGGSGDMQRANQAVNSISKALSDAQAWR